MAEQYRGDLISSLNRSVERVCETPPRLVLEGSKIMLENNVGLVDIGFLIQDRLDLLIYPSILIRDGEVLVKDEFQSFAYNLQSREWREPKADRYFALVISVPAAECPGTLLTASTEIGNMAREAGHTFLPQGSRITRSIEITKETATNGIR